MSSPALDLMVRLVAERLSAERCEDCDQPTSEARIAVRTEGDGRLAVHVTCRGCGRVSVLGVEPAGDARPG